MLLVPLSLVPMAFPLTVDLWKYTVTVLPSATLQECHSGQQHLSFLFWFEVALIRAYVLFLAGPDL